MASAPSRPQLSVLIPAFNEEALIARVLERVHASFAAIARDDYEIVVCDNNSTDRTAALAAAGGAKVVFEPHNQIGRARNTAARAASGEWLIFLDGDSYLPPELLRRTIACFESGSVAAGGATILFDGPALSLGCAAMLGFWNGISVWLRLAAGSYIFCQRAAWAETGGFDEKYYAGEELFFSRKLKHWARQRGLKFTILGGDPILTSARKIEWFGVWPLLRSTLALGLPGALKRREKCGLWYVRPPMPDPSASEV